MRYAGAIYGLMIVGWSLGGLIGPPIIAVLIPPVIMKMLCAKDSDRESSPGCPSGG